MRQVRWILTQAPVAHRTVFVERGFSPQETNARLDSVRRMAGRFALPGDNADVQETNLVSHGWSGAYYDMIDQKFRSSTPDPRLPQATEGFDVSQ